MLNKATLMGRLTHDLELRSTPTGTPVCNFSIAVDRRSKEEGTDFIDCVAWGKTAEFVCRNFGKGQLLAMVGHIQTRNWEDKQGNKRKAVEVVAEEFHFTGSKKMSGEAVNEPVGFNSLPDDDGDLPF
jgi:single-strand DNA-binding protein